MNPPHLSRAASWPAASLLSAIPTLCLAVDLAEDGRSAEVRGEAVEELSLNGRTVMRMTSQQSATVQLTDGRLQYTSVTTRLTGGQ